MTSEQFLQSIVGGEFKIGDTTVLVDEPIAELMKYYGRHVAKEVRHKAAEIALVDDPE